MRRRCRIDDSHRTGNAMRRIFCAALVAFVSAACGDDDALDGGDDNDDAPDVCDACTADAVCDPGEDEPCSCPAGFDGDGTIAGTGCADIDECAEDTHDCVDTLAICDNTEGGFTCDCVAGYTGDGTTGGSGCSLDGVDECADGTDDCAVNATCADTASGFTCTCDAGFTGDGATSGTGCTDIDECMLDSGGCAALACVNSSGSFSCAAWFTPSPFNNLLGRRDVNFLLMDKVEVTLAGEVVTGVNGLALDPLTDIVYAIVKAGGTRFLATLDTDTGVATLVGDLGDNFASIAFDSTGQMWGVTGDGATVSETLFQIDKADATTTLARALGTGADGEVIAYHPTLNMLYHWSGNGATEVETIDLNTVGLDLTPVVTSGTVAAEVFGALYDPTTDLFLVWDIASTVRTMAPDGTFSAVLFTVAEDVRASLFRSTAVPHTVTPASGALAGGTAITLTGLGLDLQGLTPALTVGGVAATDLVIVDSTTITAVTPVGGAPGPVDLVLTGDGDVPYNWPDGFSYDAALTREVAVEGPGPARARGCSGAPSDSGLSRLAVAALVLILLLRRRSETARSALLRNRLRSARRVSPGPSS
jgi:hypothetical protein